MVGFGSEPGAARPASRQTLSTRLRDDHTTFKAGVNFTSRGGAAAAGVGYEF